MMGWKKKDPEKVPEAEVVKQPIVSESSKSMTKVFAEAVVSQLPQLPVRQVKGDDGKTYHLSTQDEVLQEIREMLRELLRRTED